MILVKYNIIFVKYDIIFVNYNIIFVNYHIILVNYHKIFVNYHIIFVKYHKIFVNCYIICVILTGTGKKQLFNRYLMFLEWPHYSWQVGFVTIKQMFQTLSLCLLNFISSNPF